MTSVADRGGTQSNMKERKGRTVEVIMMSVTVGVGIRSSKGGGGERDVVPQPEKRRSGSVRQTGVLHGPLSRRITYYTPRTTAIRPSLSLLS